MTLVLTQELATSFFEHLLCAGHFSWINLLNFHSIMAKCGLYPHFAAEKLRFRKTWLRSLRATIHLDHSMAHVYAPQPVHHAFCQHLSVTPTIHNTYCTLYPMSLLHTLHITSPSDILSISSVPWISHRNWHSHPDRQTFSKMLTQLFLPWHFTHIHIYHAYNKLCLPAI